MALAPGRTVGRYEILAVLGQGGFGITYRARDTQLNREVAIKEYLPVALAVRQDGASVLPRSTEVAEDFGWGRERFIDEGRTLATLHEAPGIVQVFDFLEENGTAYIVMELLRGETLDERIKAEGALSAAELDAILWPLLDGLEKVHEAGFLHRDIKPANVLMGAENKPTLIDFGASRAAMADRTAIMTAIFTPGYAAPEQFSSAKQGPWTDIYGLGATLYHAITGKAPPSAFDRLMEDHYEPLASLQPAGFPPASAERHRCGLVGACRGAPANHRRLAHAAGRDGDRERGDGGDDHAALDASHATDPADAPHAADPADQTRRRVAHGRWRQVDRPGRGRRARAGGRRLLRLRARFCRIARRRRAASSAPSSPLAAAPVAAPPAPQAVDAPRPPGEADEAALHLGSTERQRIQVALTSLGFDTHGSDGALGPRSREMIAAWQRARNHPATGYLNAGEAQALLREAQPALQRFDEEQKRKAATPPAVSDGIYVGSLSSSTTGGGQAALRPMQAELRLAGRRLTGQLVHPTCGILPVSLSVEPSGAISGTLRLYEAASCSTNDASATGRVTGGTLTLDIRGVDMSARGTLSQRAERERQSVSPSPPGARSDVP